jgi:hypothetical protein
MIFSKVSCGVRDTRGAIEIIYLDNVNYEPTYLTYTSHLPREVFEMDRCCDGSGSTSMIDLSRGSE